MSKLFYKNIEDELTNLGFQIVDSNLEKPWGAYFCINENQAQVACDYLKKANSLQPFNKKYLSGLANVYSQLGEFNKAIELFQGYLSQSY